MRRLMLPLGLLLISVSAAPGTPQKTEHARRAPASRSDSVSELLPDDLRPHGREILAQGDETKRGKAAAALAEVEPRRAAKFLLALVERDSSPAVRGAILESLGQDGGPATRRALERHAASDPDPAVALIALERLRQQSAHDLRRLLRRRLALAESSADSQGATRLAAEDERWISIERGTMLPSFLRRPPAAFALPATPHAIHALAFGDFGDGSEDQRETAAAMTRAHRERPFDFGVTLGDNFYEAGMTGPADPRWKTQWEDLYGPLGIRFYPVLGNHDWKLSDSPAAEILYSGQSTSWSMPAPYYTFIAGPVQFFAIDTEEMSARQLAWLREGLDRSTARWKVVYGHHPVYSAGHHGDTPALVEKLLPVLRRRADVYLCGHDHDLQHLRADGGVHFFVAGGGGAHTRPLHPDARTLFGRDTHGFAVLDADDAALTVRLVGADSTELHAFTLEKPEGAGSAPQRSSDGLAPRP